MGGDVLEVGRAFRAGAHTRAVVCDREEMLAALAAARNGDIARTGIDAVLDELGHRFQWVVLRERDDGDRVPVVAYAQLPAAGQLRAARARR